MALLPVDLQAPLAPRRGAPSVSEVLNSLRMLSDHIRAVDVAHPPDGWIASEGLLDPQSGLLASLLDRIGQRYVESRRHAAAVSFMLRFGWSAGPMIAAHLGLGCHFRYQDYSLRFASSTALEAVCVQHCELIDSSADPGASRRRLLDELIAHTEPVLEAQHRWSRVSRRALWSMATSTWAAQFVEIAERLGDAELGRREAEAMFDLVPKIRRAAPRMYSVASGDRQGVCQVRGACCLSYKGPSRQHCMVCPLISEDERAQRSSTWIATRPRIRAIDPALAATLRGRTVSVSQAENTRRSPSACDGVASFPSSVETR